MIWLRLHHRGLVVVDDGVGQLGGGEYDIGLPPRLGHGFLDPTELCDGHLVRLSGPGEAQA